MFAIPPNNTDANSDNIIFTIKNASLYVLAFAVSAKVTQKLLKLKIKNQNIKSKMNKTKRNKIRNTFANNLSGNTEHNQAKLDTNSISWIFDNMIGNLGSVVTLVKGILPIFGPKADLFILDKM